MECIVIATFKKKQQANQGKHNSRWKGLSHCLYSIMVSNLLEQYLRTQIIQTPIGVFKAYKVRDRWLVSYHCRQINHVKNQVTQPTPEVSLIP